MKAEKNVELIGFTRFLEKLGWIPALTHLSSFQHEFEVYVVGGTLRDALLGITKQRFDMDLVVDPKSASRKASEILSATLGSSFFELDSERDTYRITMEQAQIDINGIRGEELIDDLFLRDFSIDALCLPLDLFLRIYRRGDTRMPILDHFQGIDDLLKRNIRIHNPSSFADDPLRMLRAYRLAGEIKGSIDPWTEEQIALHKEQLFAISGERIRDEWFKILSLPGSSDWLNLMDRTGLLGIAFPFINSFKEMDEAYTKNLRVRAHTLETLQYLEQIIQRIREGRFPYAEKISQLLQSALVPERNLGTLLKLSALLHDIGKPDTLTIESDRLRFFDHEKIGAEKASVWLKDLKLSNRENEWIEGLILGHMRPHQLSVSEPISDKAKYRFFADLGELAVPLLLLALADAYATRRIPMGELDQYESFLDEMLQFGYRDDRQHISPLLNGDDIMKLLGIPPSPRVGQILSALLEAQHLQTILHRKEAEAFVMTFKI